MSARPCRPDRAAAGPQRQPPRGVSAELASPVFDRTRGLRGLKIKLVECEADVDIRRDRFKKAVSRMEHLLLAPLSVLASCVFLLGSSVVISEVSHALGLRIAATGRRIRARWLPRPPGGR